MTSQLKKLPMGTICVPLDSMGVSMAKLGRQTSLCPNSTDNHSNMVTMHVLIPPDLTSFIFHDPFLFMFIPFLTSAHVILTTEFPVDQSGNIVVSSVLFLWLHLTLTNNVIYCFTLLVTQSTQRGID